METIAEMLAGQGLDVADDGNGGAVVTVEMTYTLGNVAWDIVRDLRKSGHDTMDGSIQVVGEYDATNETAVIRVTRRVEAAPPATAPPPPPTFDMGVWTIEQVGKAPNHNSRPMVLLSLGDVRVAVWVPHSVVKEVAGHLFAQVRLTLEVVSATQDGGE